MPDAESREIALITGASRGIGRAIALTLAREGVYVVLNYRSQSAEAEESCRLVRELGGECEAMPFDVSDGEAVDAAIKSIVEKHGKCDILVNNAGISIDSLLLRVKEEDWQKTLATNLQGTFNCSKSIARPMVRARYGRIVNMTSVIGQMGNAGQAVYAASKAGIIGFTKSLAKELGARSITVNAIAPGFIQTEMVETLPESLRSEYLKQIPAGRLGTAEEVAELVAFIASRRASYISGQVIAINGGLYM